MSADGAPSLLDTSVFARLRDGRLPEPVADELSRQIIDGAIAVTEPLRLEMLYSARDGGEYQLLADRLAALPLLELRPSAIRRALEAQAQLAAQPDISHRSAKPVDLLVAATAELYHTAVFHYDRDYEVLAERTDLEFESRWVVPRGAIS